MTHQSSEQAPHLEMLKKENLSITEESSDDIVGIDDKSIAIYIWVLYTVLCQIINIFGIVTNIINIICFAKQGFKDSVNISLLGLSVSDLGSLVTMIWTCIGLTPGVVAADLPFEPVEVTYLTTVMLHFTFTRISSCITAMVTLERCLCITAPLKIRDIITPRRTTVITVGTFIVLLFGASPVFCVNGLDLKFSPARNKSIIGLVFKADREQVETISFAINNFCIPFGAFVIIVISTIILSLKLRNATKWRMTNTVHAKIDITTSRNQKAARMVVTISTLFIVCFIPIICIVLAAAFVPALSVQGKHLNISIVIGGIGYVTESINSSMNIFIYYHMSSKYKDQFRKLFGKDGLRQQIKA